MRDTLKTLAGIQEQVTHARQLAFATKDKEASRILHQLADELDRYVKRALFAKGDLTDPHADPNRDATNTDRLLTCFAPGLSLFQFVTDR
jgi:hypothetical protein